MGGQPQRQAVVVASGGSLWLTAGALSGAGVISANGGAGGFPAGEAVAAESQFIMPPTFSKARFLARGGAGLNYGGAGTVYLSSTRQAGSPQIIVDNGGQLGTEYHSRYVGSL